jgi:diguanylate cyclase (GGDEF)-like protein
MLDTASLRVAFAVLALTLMALFYVVTYRTTRSAYAGWWCASLGLFLGGASAFLLDGTSQQVWGNPLGNVLIVSGAAAVWASARSLRSLRLRWWQLVTAPVIVGVLSAFDDPAHNEWSGGPFFLGAMWILLSLTTLDLWRQQHAYRTAHPSDGRMYWLSLWSLTLASGTMVVFYVGRWLAFLILGPGDRVFENLFGSAVTTLLTSVLLATVSFSMATLSDEQQKDVLRDLAARDGLTGLLNRTEFMRLAAMEVHRMGQEGVQGQLILADLDHFKLINDEYGHAAGDRAIRLFSGLCANAVRATDLVGRYGGEEFIVLLVGASSDRALEVTSRVGAGMEGADERFRLPTVSYGVATVDGSLDLEAVIKRADEALYQAKAQGRNRSVLYAPGPPSPQGAPT